MTTVRKLLLAVLLVSLAGSAFGAGTFASFNATTTNAAGTFATGSIVLSNTVNSQTACSSTSTGLVGTGNTDTNSHACDTLFNTTLAKPGDTSYVDLDLSNIGTINATSLTLQVSACTAGTTGTYHGSTAGAICASNTGLKVQVQEYQTHGHAGTAQAKCIYPVNASAACSTNYDYFANGFVSTTFTNPLTVAGLASSATKYVTIAIKFPDNGTSTVNGLTDNAYQGLTASFTLTWTITQ